MPTSTSPRGVKKLSLLLDFIEKNRAFKIRGLAKCRRHGWIRTEILCKMVWSRDSLLSRRPFSCQIRRPAKQVPACAVTFQPLFSVTLSHHYTICSSNLYHGSPALGRFVTEPRTSGSPRNLHFYFACGSLLAVR